MFFQSQSMRWSWNGFCVYIQTKGKATLGFFTLTQDEDERDINVLSCTMIISSYLLLFLLIQETSWFFRIYSIFAERMKVQNHSSSGETLVLVEQLKALTLRIVEGPQFQILNMKDLMLFWEWICLRTKQTLDDLTKRHGLTDDFVLLRLTSSLIGWN